MKKIRVALVDDHPIVLNGFQKMFKADERIEIVGCCLSGAAILEFLERHQVDVLLLDIHLTDMQGDEVAARALERFPALAIIALTNTSQPFSARTMIRAGVKGYLLKGADSELIATVICSVHGGIIYLDEALRDSLLTGKVGDSPFPILTSREQEVLDLIVQGYTSRDISRKLFLSVSRVDACRTDLFMKFGVKNAVALVHVTTKLGLLH